MNSFKKKKILLDEKFLTEGNFKFHPQQLGSIGSLKLDICKHCGDVHGLKKALNF